MASLTHSTSDNIQVLEVFDRYPDAICEKLLFLRQLIFEIAFELDIDDLEETLKWGEPSYLTNKGSTVRLAWRKSNPNKYGIFFNCNTSLIGTYREIYPNTFKYEGNRAIIFDENDIVPVDKLKFCIELSLRYHSIKHLLIVPKVLAY